jgi:ribonuclease VapC
VKRYVLDSYALLAYCEGEKGGEKVAQIFKQALDGEADIYLCVVNWGEMIYIALREQGEKTAELYRRTLEKYPLSIEDATQELTLQASRYKATNKMSFADAYAAALATLKKAQLVTGDREFKPLEKVLNIVWID